MVRCVKTMSSDRQPPQAIDSTEMSKDRWIVWTKYLNTDGLFEQNGGTKHSEIKAF